MRRIGLPLCAVFLLAPAAASAGPWVPAPGDGYIQGGVSFFSAQEGQREGVATGLAYRTTTFSLYGELGLPGRLMLTSYVPFVLGTNESEASGIVYSHDSLGDLTFALDHAPLASFPLAFGVEVKVPGYSDPSQYENADGIDGVLFDESKFPVLGDNNVDVTPRVQLGHSLSAFPMWMQVSLGYRFRSCQLHGSGRCRDFGDGPVVDGSIGAWVWDEHLALQLYTKGNIVTEPDTVNTIPSEESLYLQGKVTVANPALPGASLSVGVGGIPYANNAANGYDVSVSLAYKF